MEECPPSEQVASGKLISTGVDCEYSVIPSVLVLESIEDKVVTPTGKQTVKLVNSGRYTVDIMSQTVMTLVYRLCNVFPGFVKRITNWSVVLIFVVTQT